MVSRCRKLNGRMSSRHMRWSECEWVKRMKSRRGMGSRSSCRRRSGVVSIRKCCPSFSILTDCRRRLLRGSSDVQTAQRQPTTGTPVEVPVPRNVTMMNGRGSRFEVRTKNEEKIRFLPLHSHLELRTSYLNKTELVACCGLEVRGSR